MKSPIDRKAREFPVFVGFLFVAFGIAIFSQLASETFQKEDDARIREIKLSAPIDGMATDMRIENDPSVISEMIRELKRIEQRLEDGIDSGTIMDAIRNVTGAIRALQYRLEELQDDE